MENLHLFGVGIGLGLIVIGAGLGIDDLPLQRPKVSRANQRRQIKSLLRSTCPISFRRGGDFG